MTGPRPHPAEVTPLSSLDEIRFQTWAFKHKIADVDAPNSHYDYRGAFVAGVTPKLVYDDKLKKKVPHWPDTFKQHGHPTFSVESQYSTGANDGGHWNGETFVPSRSSSQPGVIDAGAARHARLRELGAIHEPSPSAQGKGSFRSYLLGEALGAGRNISAIPEAVVAQARDIGKAARGEKPTPDWDHKPTMGEIADRWKQAIGGGVSRLLRLQPESVGNALFQGATLAAPGAKGSGVPELRATLASERGAVPVRWNATANEARELSLLRTRTPAQLARLRSLNETLSSMPQEPSIPLEQSAAAPGVTDARASRVAQQLLEKDKAAPSDAMQQTYERRLARRAQRSFGPGELPKQYAIVTAENPGGTAASPEANARAMDQLKIRLQIMGKEGIPTTGAYVDAGNLLHENGIMVPGMSAAEAKQVAQSFGQNSVITHEGFHDLTTGKTTPISGVQHGVAAEAPYTELPGGRRFRMSFGQSATPLSDVVSSYRQRAGITGEPLPRVKAVDAEAGARMAKTYEGLKNDPQNPEVRAAYRAFTDETQSQAQALRDAGYSWDYVDKDPYKNSAEMLKDLRDNHHINVLKTDPAQGHPLMTPDENNLFRAVHDIMGHGVEGHNFAAPGEENAFRGHASMYSPLAQRAMATETRGQNSWFNYGPHKDLPASQRPFAEQKAALWPTEQLGDYGTFPKEQPAGRIVYHGTTKPGFDVPTMHSYGPGVHVGTAGQADEILRGAPWDPPGRLLRDSWRPDGSRIIPLRDITSKPFVLKKDAAWGDPQVFAKNMVEQGAISKEEAAGLTDFTKVRQWLLDKGYDRIDYKNRVEADRWVGGKRRLATSSVILEPEKHLSPALDPQGSPFGPPSNAELGPRSSKLTQPPVPQLSLADWNDIFRYGKFDPAEGAPGIAALSRGLPPIERGSILTPARAGSVIGDVSQEAPWVVPEPARFKRFADIKDQISRALEHPLVQEDLQRGVDMGFHDWYNTDAIMQSAIEHLGPEKGRAAFNKLMDYMGPTSISSSPEPNLRLAGYQYYRGLNPGAPQWAPGFRPLYPGLVNSKLAELEQLGALNPGQAPKLSRFTSALQGNWGGLAGDRHFWRALRSYGFEGAEKGGVAYGPAESVLADVMQNAADEGTLPVPDNRSPTAAGQAAIWGGAGERTGVRNIADAPPTFSDIFEQGVHRTAHFTGMPHGDVLNAFWNGRMPLF